jgi:S-adenosylmethionine/arginine decarboxylase-like enzyme
MYWGYHLILDSAKCIPKTIRCKQNIYNFTTDLVKKIDMVPYGQPQIQHFGSGNKAGYTLVQLIETSNICAHFVEETDDMYLDVFSCKPFEPKDVEHMVEKYFQPKNKTSTFLTRNASNPNMLKLTNNKDTDVNGYFELE